MRGYEREMARARQVTDRSMRGIETSAKTSATRLSAIMTNAGRTAASGLMTGLAVLGAGGVVAGLGFAALVDTARQAAAELAKIGDVAGRVGVTAEALQALQFASEQNAGSAQAVNDGLTRFAAGLADASTKSGELYKILVANNVAFTDMNGKLLPTEQVLLRFADLVKNARTPAEALELAIRAFGRSAGPELVSMLTQGSDGLRQMMQEARDAGAVLDNALIKKAQDIDDEFNKIAITVGMRVKGSIIAVAAQMREFYDLVSAVQAKFEAFGNSDVFRKVYEGAKALGLGGMNGVEDVNRFDQVFGADAKARANPGSMAGYRPPGATAPAAPPTVLPAAGEGGKSEADRLAESYRKLHETALARIADLRVEQQTMGMATAAAEALRFEQELLNRAAVAGLQLSPQQRQEISQLAQQYGTLSAAVESAKEAQQELQSLGKEVLGSFINDLRQGKSAAEALTNALNKVVDKLLDMALNSLFDSKGGGLGSIIGQLLGGARASGGPVQAGKTYLVGENGPEMVRFGRNGTVVPNSAVAGGGGGGAGKIIVNNYAGAQVSSRRERGPGGDMTTVFDIVKADVAREAGRNGSFARAMGAPGNWRG